MKNLRLVLFFVFCFFFGSDQLVKTDSTKQQINLTLRWGDFLKAYKLVDCDFCIGRTRAIMKKIVHKFSHKTSSDASIIVGFKKNPTTFFGANETIITL